VRGSTELLGIEIEKTKSGHGRKGKRMNEK